MKVNVNAGTIGTQNNADLIHVGAGSAPAAAAIPSRAERAEGGSEAVEGVKAIFISHASRDASLVEAVVNLLSRALLIGSADVRCTTVDGYRLATGALVSTTLRQEIRDARIFVALLTPASMASPYVLFELGARWGQGTPLLPVIAKGWEASSLQPPLSELSCLRLDRRGEVVQFVADIGKLLGGSVEPVASYASAVERVLELAPAAQG